MSVLDELRDQMEQFDVADAGFSPQAVQVAMVGLLDAFAEAHPGLVDMTFACQHCGTVAGPNPAGVLLIREVVCGEPMTCPTCAKETTE